MMLTPPAAGVKTLVHRTLGQRRAHREYEQARSACGPDEMVCGVVLPDGRPTYYVAKRDTPDEVLEAKAFEVYHGRPPQQGEVTLWRMARSRLAKAAQ